jgi:hypothetical protein
VRLDRYDFIDGYFSDRRGGDFIIVRMSRIVMQGCLRAKQLMGNPWEDAECNECHKRGAEAARPLT